MSVFSYPKAPEELLTFDEPSTKSMVRAISRVVNGAMSGKINAIGEVTLTANVTTTVLTDARLAISSLVIFDPVTANAAAALYGGAVYVLSADRRNGAHTITHANNAQTDRTFKYLVVG
jgi:hypothetical protein